jgi:hypothetical protein
VEKIPVDAAFYHPFWYSSWPHCYLEGKK